jgi:hypothetical protein
LLEALLLLSEVFLAFNEDHGDQSALAVMDNAGSTEDDCCRAERRPNTEWYYLQARE